MLELSARPETGALGGHRAIGLRAARELLGAGDDARVEVGPLRVHRFSFTFSVAAAGPSGARHAFVKIPKEDMGGRAPSLLPVTAEDRRMAREEEESLRLLQRRWDGAAERVRWVALQGALPEHNALVTERAFAEEGFRVFRRLDGRRRLGFPGAAGRLRDAMTRLGRALGRFHRAEAEPAIFRLSEMLPKLERYARELTVLAPSSVPEKLLDALRPWAKTELAGFRASTLKGLDVRNVLMDGKGGLVLLDPGKTKRAFREADLARFLMTYRILYWGSPLLPLAGTPDRGAEKAFLDACRESGGPSSPRLLSFFLVKEQLKHWRTALDSLRRRPWPEPLKAAARRLYVNPFYERQLAAELESLRREAQRHD